MDLDVSSELATYSVLFFGFVLGLKHAVEADHLAAVSTIVAERSSILSSTLVGGLWGFGHTAALLIVGSLVIFLKLQISSPLEAKLEAVVGGMLILLGLNALRKLWRMETIHVHTHEHEGRKHLHLHGHESVIKEENHHFLKFTPRAVAIGMVHGVAGSAGLMLLILPTISSPGVAMAYILIFGLGSIFGMMAMSLLIALPFYFSTGKFGIVNKSILAVAGVFSSVLGGYIVYEKLLS